MKTKWVSLLAILFVLCFTAELRAQTMPFLSLSWTDNSTDETGFDINRCSGVGCTPVPLSTVGPNVVSFTDSGLNQATTYCYNVDGFNTVGKSATTNIACALTPAQVLLAKAGTGQGTVTSAPSGINCGTTCSAWFAGNSSVVLSAQAAAGSVFTGWSGGCTGTGTCTLSMNSTKSVTATFGPAPTAPNAPTSLIVK